MTTIEGPNMGINLGIFNPQGKHANHYTNGNNKNNVSKYKYILLFSVSDVQIFPQRFPAKITVDKRDDLLIPITGLMDYKWLEGSLLL